MAFCPKQADLTNDLYDLSMVTFRTLGEMASAGTEGWLGLLTLATGLQRCPCDKVPPGGFSSGPVPISLAQSLWQIGRFQALGLKPIHISI